MATADSQAFTLQVNSPATFPLWDTVIPTQNLVVGTPFSLDLDSVCTDAAGLFSTYSLVSGALPAGLTLSGTRNRIVSGTPTTAGNVNSTLRANDGVVNVAPVWAITPTPSFTQGTAAFHPASGTYQTNSYVTDVDGDPITIAKNAAALPAGVTFTSGASARFAYNGTSPVASTSGHILTADDGQGHAIAGSSFGVSIVAPAFPAWDAIIPTQNLTVGVFFSLDLDTVCTDGPSLLSTYSLVSGALPAGLTLSGTRNRILSGTPTTAGTSTPTIRANDGVANVAPVWNSTPNPAFTLGVAATNPASGTYQSNNVVTDANGDTITVSENAAALQSGVTFTTGTAARFVYSGGGSVGTTTGHILTANDGQGNVIAGNPFSISIAGSGTGADADFALRRSSPGVIRSFGFDTPADIGGNDLANYGTIPGNGTVYIDSAMKSSGNSALGFDVLAGVGNSATWFTNFSSDLLTLFGANTSFFCQWKYRVTPTILSDWGLKYVLIGTGNEAGSSTIWYSCTDIEIEMETYATVNGISPQNQFPVMYNACPGSCSGTHGFFSSVAGSDYDMQPGGLSPICSYQDSQKLGCKHFVADSWMVFQVGVNLGPRILQGGDAWYQNSRVRLWMQDAPGAPEDLVIDFTSGVTQGPGGPITVPGLCAASGDRVNINQRYGKIWFLPYTQASVANPRAGKVWADELIIGTQKIPAALA